MSLIGKRKSKSKLLGEPKIEVMNEGSSNAVPPNTQPSGTSVSDDFGTLFNILNLTTSPQKFMIRIFILLTHIIRDFTVNKLN